MSALLLIDLQNDYFPGGAMELVGILQAAERGRLLLTEFRRRGRLVVHIQHIAIRPNAAFLLPGTHGAQIHHMVRPLVTEIVLHKNYPNSFRGTALLNVLKTMQVSELVIAGMTTHMCIDSTARAAFDLGFKLKVASDACATRNLTFSGLTVKAADVQLAYMSALNGIFSEVKDTEEIIAELDR